MKMLLFFEQKGLVPPPYNDSVHKVGTNLETMLHQVAACDFPWHGT
jgi:hypothetical protein